MDVETKIELKTTLLNMGVSDVGFGTDLNSQLQGGSKCSCSLVASGCK